MKKTLDEMKYDELIHVAQFRHGFTTDEVKLLYPTEDKLREFLSESSKGRGLIPTPASEESKIGWDSEDDTPLDDDATRVVTARRKAKEASLARSIAATGSVTAADVKNVRSILNDMDEEDEEDDPVVEKPPVKKKAKKKSARK